MKEFLKLKKSNCKNCYKCIRHCPVKSIRFSAGQANIVSDECILCGQCFVVCPQGAKEISDSTEQVRVLLQQNDCVYASVAPSYIANYDGLGFAALEEAATMYAVLRATHDGGHAEMRLVAEQESIAHPDEVFDAVEIVARMP